MAELNNKAIKIRLEIEKVIDTGELIIDNAKRFTTDTKPIHITDSITVPFPYLETPSYMKNDYTNWVTGIKIVLSTIDRNEYHDLINGYLSSGQYLTSCKEMLRNSEKIVSFLKEYSNELAKQIRNEKPVFEINEAQKGKINNYNKYNKVEPETVVKEYKEFKIWSNDNVTLADKPIDLEPRLKRILTLFINRHGSKIDHDTIKDEAGSKKTILYSTISKYINKINGQITLQKHFHKKIIINCREGFWKLNI